jgi:hypothetical protein
MGNSQLSCKVLGTNGLSSQSIKLMQKKNRSKELINSWSKKQFDSFW